MFNFQKFITTTNPIIKFVKSIARKIFHSLDIKILSLYKNKEKIEFIKQLRKENEVPLFNTEALQIINCVEAARKLEGDFAEVGVYKGASAKLVAEYKAHTKLYLFDTFDDGLPQTGKYDDRTNLTEATQKAKLDDVKFFLREYTEIYFYKGLFPNTAGPIKNKVFSFVHFDVNLYQSTKDCLEFFYPRMIRGGIILSHDYSLLPGVKNAFDEFFAARPELVIELSTTQCMVIKTY